MQIDIDYLEPKNALEDYIIDTGDSLIIEFENNPEVLILMNPLMIENLSYLQPRNDLKNYILDSKDVLDIKFTYVPELNSMKKLIKKVKYICQKLALFI